MLQGTESIRFAAVHPEQEDSPVEGIPVEDSPVGAGSLPVEGSLAVEDSLAVEEDILAVVEDILAVVEDILAVVVEGTLGTGRDTWEADLCTLEVVP